MPDISRSVGIVVPNTEPGAEVAIQTFPRQAEGLGYQSLWVTDHLVGVRGMAPVHGPYWLDPLTCLAHMAATTTSARLGIGVLVVPYRNPVLTAKMLTTIDLLSGGRLEVGIGTGWSRAEYRALGVLDHFDARGRVTDEALTVMAKCWHGGEVEHGGEFFAFRHVNVEPSHKPPPPLWIGGQSGPALRRAARLADVWHPHDISPREVREIGGRLDEMAGRMVPRSVRIHLGADDIPGVADQVDAFVDAGCEHVVIEFRSVPVEVTAAYAEKAALLLFG